MNREQLLQHHRDLCERAFQIMQRKNHDYAGDSGERPFANFERTEAMGICSTEQGFLCRMCDKLSRLSTFANAGKLMVENESYEDALLDIMNYCILFSGYVNSKKD